LFIKSGIYKRNGKGFNIHRGRYYLNYDNGISQEKPVENADFWTGMRIKIEPLDTSKRPEIDRERDAIGEAGP